MRRTLVATHPHTDLYGSGRMFLESMAALAAADWHVIVVVPDEGPVADRARGLGLQVCVLRLPVLRKQAVTPAGLVRLLVETCRAVPRIVRLLRRPGTQAVYVNTVTVPAFLVAAALARVPALCHVHEAEAEQPRLVRLALALPLLLARVVVVNSRFAEETVARDLPALRRRTTLVYNGVPGPADVSPLRPALGGPVALVLVGRLSQRKGSDVAVRAVRALLDRGVDCRLRLVGDVFPGYEPFVEGLQRLVVELGVDDRIEFAGFSEDVWPHYAAADVVLVPSRIEPFGNVAVEGLLAGRPVVASSIPGLREIFDVGRTGVLVAPDDPEALADGVASLVADWPAAVRMAAAGRADVDRRFGVTRYSDEMLRTVDFLVAPGNPRP